ncbi:hypothetical protein PYCCODRAFT_595659 [Trametes coccinea BRFM310]|uniref:Uncharacterized protein n=1 Tax=Trametes coccinea (strain BRFM310) TaxID=1353009 RepID=A0A1Y2J4H9_TRAC3|nr:hypothetical protein PYCCODRAFT_595659 [Trametes coccinea BRFM310]
MSFLGSRTSSVCTLRCRYLWSMSYFRTSNGNATAIKALVAGLVVINAVQMGVTTAAVVTSVVVDFGHVSALLDNNWTIITQIFFTTLTAAIVQSYFVYRLHHARRCLSLTLVASLFIFVQFVMSIYSVAQTFQDGYVTVMLLQSVDVWALVTTFGISAGVNIVLAAYGHVWLQKPYEIRKNGRTTVIDQVEYWTFKSLFLCGILSAYNAIGVSIFRLNLSWLGFTFILGNLYTLSVILNATEGIYAPVVPIANGSRGPATEADSVRPPSTATLTNDNELWEDIAKNQKIMALEQSAAMTVEKVSRTVFLEELALCAEHIQPAFGGHEHVCPRLPRGKLCCLDGGELGTVTGKDGMRTGRCSPCLVSALS